jgi:hypothetical protein
MAVLTPAVPIEEIVAQLIAVEADHPGAEVRQEKAIDGKSGQHRKPLNRWAKQSPWPLIGGLTIRWSCSPTLDSLAGGHQNLPGDGDS